MGLAIICSIAAIVIAVIGMLSNLAVVPYFPGPHQLLVRIL